MSDVNAVVITFSDRSKAFEAFSKLKQLSAEDRFNLREAHLVTRNEDGTLSNPEGLDVDAGAGTWGGGLIGMLVGILGGPIGVLLGYASGALIGAGVDANRADRSLTVLDEVSKRITVGGTAIVAEIEEYTPEVLDTAAAHLGGTVYRRPAWEILSELEAAEEAYRQAEKEADRVAREQRKAERKEDFEERKTALKEKLGIN